MMSDEEAANGMTREQATLRGLEFGWNSIFESSGQDHGKIGQGIHALQDAIAGLAERAHLTLEMVHRAYVNAWVGYSSVYEEMTCEVERYISAFSW